LRFVEGPRNVWETRWGKCENVSAGSFPEKPAVRYWLSPGGNLRENGRRKSRLDIKHYSNEICFWL